MTQGRGSQTKPMRHAAATIMVTETAGKARVQEPVRIGVPLPRGLARDATELRLLDAEMRFVLCQFKPLAVWSDRSLKWVLVDALIDLPADQRAVFSISHVADDAAAVFPTSKTLTIARRDDGVAVDTGVAYFSFERQSQGLLSGVRVDGVDLLATGGFEMRLQTSQGTEYRAIVDDVKVEEEGPVRAAVVLTGGFASETGRSALSLKVRFVFTVGVAAVRTEVVIRNPSAARHSGGLWDLGDAGSVYLKDLSLRLRPSAPVEEVRWYAEDDAVPATFDAPVDLRVYQDSSGGENWDSPNHVDGDNSLSVSFRGYRVTAGTSDTERAIAEGARATPNLQLFTASGWLAGTVHQFWQNFPKALRFTDGALSIGLFPAECPAGFELQGGEQKRHWALLDFGVGDQRCRIPEMQSPVAVCLDGSLVEHTEAIPWFAARGPTNDPYSSYVANVVEGPYDFFKKREIVDEYGWRNFGDLYADHETAHHRGAKPMVSHYNNQYDFIYGAFAQFLRTGDSRWRSLMEELACHCIDIDIYHTQDDRAAYNGGLFWHTDHYRDAYTCTHRTYSRHNGGRGYGGGPSNEHNYTSGLLHYYYLTGDAEAAQAVGELADWVVGMDDGSLNLLGLVDSGPTGSASKTCTSDYHGPGRGAGNSINALLDSYRLKGDQRLLRKAEDLIRRCINPADDIASRQLDDPEHRWSYLVFLQVLGKYLEFKRERGEIDGYYHYARESFLHYARWMLANEVPYKDVLHKVEIPTETWPAHDIRKCHVLYVASQYAAPGEQENFRERAEFFFKRCLSDLLSFETAYQTRPMVILCVYGYVRDFFERQGLGGKEDPAHAYTFGEPEGFLPQRDRLAAELRRRLALVSTEIRRLFRDRLDALTRRANGRH